MGRVYFASQSAVTNLYRRVMGAANYHLPSGDAQTKSAIMDSFFPGRKSTGLSFSAWKERKMQRLFECPFIDNNRGLSFFVFPNKTTPESARMQSSQKKVRSIFEHLAWPFYCFFTSRCICFVCVRAGDVHLGKRSVCWLPRPRSYAPLVLLSLIFERQTAECLCWMTTCPRRRQIFLLPVTSFGCCMWWGWW